MKISLYVYNGAASNAAFIQFKNNINLLRIVKPNCSSNFLVFHRYILWIWHQKPTLTRNSRPPSPQKFRLCQVWAPLLLRSLWSDPAQTDRDQPAATILLWSKIKCGYIFFYQRILARKQWFRNLLHWRCLRYIFLRSGLLQSFKLQTTKTADSKTAWTFFIKLLSKLPFYQTVTQNHFIYSSLASQSSPAFRRNEIWMKSLNHSSITSNRIYSFSSSSEERTTEQTRCENSN